MKRVSTITIGENRDKPRIWLQNRFMEQAGFTKGTPIRITFGEKKITIAKDVDGENHVSGTGKRAPIIDINTDKIRESLPRVKNISVTIENGHISIFRSLWENRLDQPRTNTVGEIYSGIGLFGQAAKEAGFESKWAIEKNSDYADIWARNHAGVMYNSDIADVNVDDLEKPELLIAGVPCEPFSIARQNGCEWDDHENADLALFLMPYIMKLQPRYIVLEEVPAFATSTIGKLLIQSLKRCHYNVTVKTVAGTEYGEPTVRRRAVIFAALDDTPFPEIATETVRLQDLLLPVDSEECEWFHIDDKTWLRDHWATQKAKGNNFFSQVIQYGISDTVGAITRRYFAQQGSNPIVGHPTIPDTYRWLSITEVKRIMGLPEDYYLGTSKTTAGEGMGQGVLVRIFKRILDGLKYD